MNYLTAEQEVMAMDRINYYKKAGFTLWAEDAKLKFRVKEGKMTDQLKSELVKDKPILIKYFGHESERASSSFRLTPIQEAYVIGSKGGYQLGDTNAHYYSEYQITGLDKEKFQRVLNELIKEYDALRLVINSDGTQRVLKKVPEYMVKVNANVTDEELKNIRKKWSHHRYEYDSWPMFHFEISDNDNTSILHFSFDCLIMDAWSASMMINMLFDYCKYDKDIKKVSYSFEKYMRDVVSKNKLEPDEKAKAYWSEKLKKLYDSPKLSYSCDFDKVASIRYQRLSYSFTPVETQTLYDKSKACFITPSQVLCTIFMKVLAHYSKNKKLTIDLTLFNRFMLNEEVNDLLGDFTNVGFTSYEEKQDTTFLTEVKDVSKQFWKVVQFHDYDGTRVLKELGRKQPGKAVMPIVFTSVLTGDITKCADYYKEIYAISQTPQTAIDHQLRDDNGYLQLSWDYITALFDEKYIHNVFDTYIAVIKKVINEDWNNQILVD